MCVHTVYSCTHTHAHAHTQTHKQREYQCEAQNKGACEFGQVSVSEAACMYVCVRRL